MSEHMAVAAVPWALGALALFAVVAASGFTAWEMSRTGESGSSIPVVVAAFFSALTVAVIVFGVQAALVAGRIDDVAEHTGVGVEKITRHNGSGHRFDVPTGKDSFLVCEVSSAGVSCPSVAGQSFPVEQ